MKRILFVTAILLMAAGANAMPEWPRKYATTLVRGHVRNLPKDVEHITTSIACGLPDENLKGETLTHEKPDSAGTFSMKMKMCWPNVQSIEISEIRIMGFEDCRIHQFVLAYEHVVNLTETGTHHFKEFVKLLVAARCAVAQVALLVPVFRVH